MNIGNGSLGYIKQPAPGITNNSAENGVSVENGKVVLGNEAGQMFAQLLSVREIPLNTFSIALTKAIGQTILDAGYLDLTNNEASGNSPRLIFRDTDNGLVEAALSLGLAIKRVFLSYGNFAPDPPKSTYIAPGENDVEVGSAEGVVDDLLRVLGGVYSDSIKTEGAPNGNAKWQLGQVVTDATIIDNTKYVEIVINGEVIKLAVCQ